MEKKWTIQLFGDVSITVTMDTYGNINYSSIPSMIKDHDMISWEVDKNQNKIVLSFGKQTDEHIDFAIIHYDGSFDPTIDSSTLERAMKSCSRLNQDKETVIVGDNITAVELRSLFEFLKGNHTQAEKDIFFKNMKELSKSDESTYAIGKFTDLHTHFNEMLSGKQLVDLYLKLLKDHEVDRTKAIIPFFREYTDKIGVDKTGKLILPPTTSFAISQKHDNGENPYGPDSDTPEAAQIYGFVSIDQIENDPSIKESLYNQFSLGLNGQVPFNYMNMLLTRRTYFRDYVAKAIYKKEEGHDYDKTIKAIDSQESTLTLEEKKEKKSKINKKLFEIKDEIELEMLIKSLSILKSQGITYTELSYQNYEFIKKVYEYRQDPNNRIPEGIKFGFLWGMSRKSLLKSKSKNNINTNLKNFKKLLIGGKIIGFDLYGEEIGITPNTRSAYKEVIKQVLEAMIFYREKNVDKPMPVLRLHAGENIGSRNNPLESLKIIDEAIKEISQQPSIQLITEDGTEEIETPKFFSYPQIRIGHGLYFNPNQKELDEYRELLRKYKVIVEINATSNVTLTNIDEIDGIPYQWYKKNGIPVVLGTDGGGMYLTDAKQERIIARTDYGEPIEDDHLLSPTDNPTDGEKLPKQQVEYPIDIIRESDNDIIQKLHSNPEEFIKILHEKYEKEIIKYNLANYIKNGDITNNPEELNGYLIDDNIIYQAINNKTDDNNYVGTYIYNESSRIVQELYYESNFGLPFDKYYEHFDKIAYSDALLEQIQIDNFTFDGKAITDEKEQAIEVIRRIQHHLHDAQSNGFYYTVEQLILIISVIDAAQDAINNGDIETAKLKVTALEVEFDLDIEFLPTLKKIYTEDLSIPEILSSSYVYTGNNPERGMRR